MKKWIEYAFLGSVLFPFVFLALLSIGQNWRFPVLFPSDWTLENWRTVLAGESALGWSLLRSLLISFSMAVSATGLGFITGKHIAYDKNRNHWLLAAYFPYVFAPVILAAMLQFYFARLDMLGSTGGVMLAQLFITYPFSVIFFTSFWNQRMRSMAQLAATLGSNRLQTYRWVLLPMAKGALLVCFYQTFLISWFEYGLTMLIGVGKVQTLTVKVWQYIGEANVFFAALASVLLVLPPIFLLWINKRVLFKT